METYKNMGEKSDSHIYEPTKIDIEEVEKPEFTALFDWAADIPDRSFAYDFWARGNYTRRLADLVLNKKKPLIVPFRYVDELRWAYRRLALAGVPVEFVYCGDLGKPKNILTLHPAGDYKIDAGWGYIGTLDTKKIKGREWFPVFGYAKLLPDSIVDWIFEEASSAFLNGDVFVSAAELVGVSAKMNDEGFNALLEVTDGSIVSADLNAAKAIASIEIPFVDHMSSHEFDRLLSEHEDDLIRFRYAVSSLMSEKDANIDELISALRAEVADLRFSDKHSKLRMSISKAGGVLGVFGSSVCAATSTFPELALGSSVVTAAAGSAAGTTAVMSLVDIMHQLKDQEIARNSNRFSLLWKLGMEKPSRVKKARKSVLFKKYNRKNTSLPSDSFNCHWLCPPTCGVRLAFVKKND